MQTDLIKDLRYTNELAMNEVYQKLLEAEKELADGKMADGKVVFASLRAKHE